MSSKKKAVKREIRYSQLKRILAGVGYMLPGSLVKRYMPCGKASCRCARGRRNYHGPYYQWSVALRGKHLAIRLTTAQARLYQEWIQNNRKARKVLDEMRVISMRVAEHQTKAMPRR